MEPARASTFEPCTTAEDFLTTDKRDGRRSGTMKMGLATGIRAFLGNKNQIFSNPILSSICVHLSNLRLK
jgi:hypothetical protein